MALVSKQLGQSRPADTSVVSVYSPSGSVRAIIKTIVICNTSALDATFRLFLDDDGTTYDESTALFWDYTVPSGVSLVLNMFAAMNNTAGNLAVRTSVASALTFTVFGAEI